MGKPGFVVLLLLPVACFNPDASELSETSSGATDDAIADETTGRGSSLDPIEGSTSSDAAESSEGLETSDVTGDTATLPACEIEGLPPLQAPLLVGPMRGLYTGSLHAAEDGTLRPQLTWQTIESPCGGVQYQLQMDDSCGAGSLVECAFASPEIDDATIIEAAFTPGADLNVSLVSPVGALYAWRVRACDAGTRCSPWSEVRSLQVGRIRHDLNGDGYSDIVTVTSGTSGIIVFTGSSQFDQIADVQDIAPSFSLSRFVGDVNGDGYGDLGGTIGYAPTSGNAPHLVFGGPDLSALQGLTLTASAGSPSTNTVLMPAGDLNGDGFAEVTVHLNNQARTDIYLGGRTLAGTADLSLTTPLTEIYSTPASGNVGDVNGDGYEDLVLVVTPDLDAAQILFGGADLQATLSAPIPMGQSCGFSTIFVAGGGDLNRDGFEDFFVACSDVGMFAYFGSATPVETWAAERRDLDVTTVAGQFDLDRDGMSDAIIGRPAAAPQLFRGNALFDLQTPELDALGNLFSSEQVAVADHNGDGFWDIVVGGFETPLRRANGDGSLDPAAPGSFVDGTDINIEGRIAY